MFASKKSVGLIFVSLIFLSLFVGLVSAQGTFTPPPTSTIPSSWGIFQPVVDFVKSIGTGWSAGEGYSFGVAKFFILIIIWILIGGILDKFPGLGGNQTGKKYMRFFLSFAIAFLASAYFTATELAVIISSYSAMGFVLGGIVPFLIMVFFTTSTVSSINEAKGSAAVQLWTLRGLWAVFGTYFLYRVFSVGGASASDFIVWGHWIFVGLSVLVVAFLPKYIKGALKAQSEAFFEAAERDVEMRAQLRAEKVESMNALKEKLSQAKGVRKNFKESGS